MKKRLKAEASARAARDSLAALAQHPRVAGPHPPTTIPTRREEPLQVSGAVVGILHRIATS